MNHTELCAALDHLLRETYALWDAGWVTFNWRNYTYDHVQRVRGLALTLCRAEGGDPVVTELAALLHDITKPYDGEYIVGNDGKRLVDEFGYWRNEVRLPARTNCITRAYDELGLAGQLHNESGAALADWLLSTYDVPAEIRARVAAAIRHHIVPPANAPVESRCLSDADTIDANLGLPAFVRNIYINLHFYDTRKAPEAPPIARVLEENPLGFLRPYITENLPRWNAGKRRDFIPKLLTQTGRELSLARLERLDGVFAALAEELDDYATHSRHGELAIILHYMSHQDDPSIAAETYYLANDWLQNNGAGPAARELLNHLLQEIAGTI